MKKEIFDFFSLQRQIFGLCPHCHELFRLSECDIYLKQRPVQDWMTAIDRETARLGELEARIEDKKEALREKARVQGRASALKAARKVDQVFSPRRLNPDDAKVLFHPVDYIVFDGMKNGEMKSLLLLDRQTTDKQHRKVQGSIEKAVAKQRCGWQTLRVGVEGEIESE